MLHEILVDFPGSQDGTATENFVAGTRRELSAYLAALVVPCGWAKPVEQEADAPGEAERVADESDPAEAQHHARTSHRPVSRHKR
jgi:hypothetical protein